MSDSFYMYFASFASGMQFIVKDILEKQIPDVKILNLFDGAIVFKTQKSYDKLNMYCFNNIFSVITFAKKKMPNSIEVFIKEIINSRLQSVIISNNTQKYKTFRVVISLENQLVSIDKGLKTKLENLISLQSKLKLNRSNSDAEFWLVYRSEGFCFFMKRLTKHTAYEKILNKGELHPEIAFLMNWFSEVSKDDVVLDPFCGYGAIPLKRLLHFSSKIVYAFDFDSKMISATEKKIVGKKSLSNMKNIFLKCVDVKNLDEVLESECIDKIVTDPPWGLYENIGMDVDEFYILALSKMEKVLKNNGTIVLLLSRQINIEELIKTVPNLSLIQNYGVLISGKKANLIKIRKSVSDFKCTPQSLQ